MLHDRTDHQLVEILLWDSYKYVHVDQGVAKSSDEKDETAGWHNPCRVGNR